MIKFTFACLATTVVGLSLEAETEHDELMFAQIRAQVEAEIQAEIQAEIEAENETEAEA